MVKKTTPIFRTTKKLQALRKLCELLRVYASVASINISKRVLSITTYSTYTMTYSTVALDIDGSSISGGSVSGFIELSTTVAALRKHLTNRSEIAILTGENGLIQISRISLDGTLVGGASIISVSDVRPEQSKEPLTTAVFLQGVKECITSKAVHASELLRILTTQSVMGGKGASVGRVTATIENSVQQLEWSVVGRGGSASTTTLRCTDEKSSLLSTPHGFDNKLASASYFVAQMYTIHPILEIVGTVHAIHVSDKGVLVHLTNRVLGISVHCMFVHVELLDIDSY